MCLPIIPALILGSGAAAIGAGAASIDAGGGSSSGSRADYIAEKERLKQEKQKAEYDASEEGQANKKAQEVEAEAARKRSEANEKYKKDNEDAGKILNPTPNDGRGMYVWPTDPGTGTTEPPVEEGPIGTPEETNTNDPNYIGDPNATYTASQRRKRLAALRTGLASTIKTSPIGLTNAAQTLTPSVMATGLKTKLGV